MTTSIFEQATKQKLRFLTQKGELSTETLWELPLQSRSSINLDDLAKQVNARLKSSDVESFVTDNVNANADDKLRLDILKHIINAKLKERDARRDAIETAERKKVLLAALANKQSENIQNLSEEDIKAELAKLDNPDSSKTEDA